MFLEFGSASFHLCEITFLNKLLELLSLIILLDYNMRIDWLIRLFRFSSTNFIFCTMANTDLKYNKLSIET